MTDTPKMKPPKINSLPWAMVNAAHWVNWRYFYDRSKDRWGKMPINPKTLRSAEANDPTTWGTFAQCCDNLTRDHDLGIGFEIGKKTAGTHSGLLCIDLDHVLQDGVIQDPAALDIFETLDSYTEISPGGDGLHIWIKAEVTEDRRKRKGKIEIYSDGRFITITGNQYGTRTTIEERTAKANEIIDKYLETPKAEDPGHNTAPAADPGVLAWDSVIQYDGWTGEPDSDDVILQKMCASNPNAAALFNGNFSTYINEETGQADHSAADQALVNILAYWANYDAATVDRLFRRSGLMRPKWNDMHDPEHGRTYGQMTIDRALAGHTPRTPQAAPKKDPPSTVETSQPTQQPIRSEEQETDAKTSVDENDVYLYSAAQARGSFEDMIVIETEPIRTGFPYLDQLLDGGLYPGLIIMGAVTGEGKTTLALQMMDNIAATGKDVLIFSLEMSRYELMAKSISRLGFKYAVDKEDAFTTRELLKYKDYPKYSEDRLRLIERMKREYFETIAPHVFIREAKITGISIDTIVSALNAHRDQTGETPVVLVDYIQLLSQPASIRRNLTDKQVIDTNVMSLKQISRSFNTPVIGISSLNRQAYSVRNKPQGSGPQDNRVTLTDFKESGAIEYSCDILLGLNKIEFFNQNTTASMSLDFLKNRNGKKDVAQGFTYYYRYNCFQERNLTAAPNVV